MHALENLVINCRKKIGPRNLTMLYFARMAASTRPISDFIDRHFLHFNAATLKDATDAYTKHLENSASRSPR